MGTLLHFRRKCKRKDDRFEPKPVTHVSGTDKENNGRAEECLALLFRTSDRRRFAVVKLKTRDRIDRQDLRRLISHAGNWPLSPAPSFAVEFLSWKSSGILSPVTPGLSGPC